MAALKCVLSWWCFAVLNYVCIMLVRTSLNISPKCDTLTALSLSNSLCTRQTGGSIIGYHLGGSPQSA